MGKHDGSEASVTLTKAELAELLAGSVKAALEVVRGPVPQTDQERFDQFSESLRTPAAPSEITEQMVPCISPTGATFTARVVKSRTYPQGRVVQLDDYRQPEGFDVPARSGGLYPGEVEQIFASNAGSQERKDYSVQFKKWSWETYWREDLRAFVGKPLPLHIRVDMQAKMASLEAG